MDEHDPFSVGSKHRIDHPRIVQPRAQLAGPVRRAHRERRELRGPRRDRRGGQRDRDRGTAEKLPGSHDAFLLSLLTK
jgi:hypothetical protein